MTEEKGLVYPDGEEATWDEVDRRVKMREFAKAADVEVDIDAQAPCRDLETWHEIMKRRKRERKEILGVPEDVRVDIKTKKPILIGLFGDIHAGGADVDYDRLAKDIDLLKSVDGFAITVGDLTDSFFFNSGQHEALANNQEQVLYMQAVLDELSKDDRLLAGWKGDHDGWAEDKMGTRTTYHEFGRRYHGHYLEGVSYLTVGLNDDIEYKLTGAHRHKGFSVYNDAHASLRMEKDEGRGSDVAFTAHNHVKAYLQQTVKNYGGNENRVHLLALGAYKKTDGYSRKHGWPRKDDSSLGAFGLILRPDKKDVQVCWTLEDGVERLQQIT
jgi:hypothetical protein